MGSFTLEKPVSIKDALIGAKGGGSSFRNRPDNLRSKDTFEALIGLVSGPIQGLAPGGLKNLFVDDVPMEDGQGNSNLKDFAAILNIGDPSALEPIKLQLGGSSGAVSVGLPINNPTTGTVPGEWRNAVVTQPGVDFIDIRLMVSALYRQDKKGFYDETASLEVQIQPSGSTTWINPLLSTSAPTYDQNGFAVSGKPFFRLYVQSEMWDRNVSGQWKESSPGYLKITGKTTQAYVKELRVSVPNTGVWASKTWSVRIRLKERDSYTLDQNEERRTISWESIGGVSSAPIGGTEEWRGLAHLQLFGKASDQISGIPTVTGIYDLAKVKVPPTSVWDPSTRVYTGTAWNGVTNDISWTQCPAWQIKDLVEDPISGLSALAPGSTMNKWDILQASKWYSQLVSDGRGGMHPRYSMNYLIDSGMAVNELMQYVAGAVGSYAYDQGDGDWRLVVDQPKNASALFTKEDVVGEFNYSHTDIDTRFNDLIGVFRNEENRFQEDRVRVFDQPHIDMYGRRHQSIALVGCTNRQEALRRMKLRQLVSINETRMVSFTTNRKGQLLSPFDVVLIADGDLGIDDDRSTGRIIALNGARTQVTVRDPIRLEVGVTYKVNFTIPNPNYNPETTTQPTNVDWDKPTITIERTLINTAEQRGDVYDMYLSVALPANIPTNANFALSAVGLPTLPKQYQVLDVSRDDDEIVKISAVEIYTSKWLESDGVVESEILGQVPDKTVPSPTDIQFQVRTYKSEFQDKKVLSVTWDRPGSIWIKGFEVKYSFNNGPVKILSENSKDNYVEMSEPASGVYTFFITTIDRRNDNKSQPLSESYEILETAPVGAPDEFGTLANRPAVGLVNGHRYTVTDITPQTTYVWNGIQWVKASTKVEFAEEVAYGNGQSVEELKPAQIGADVTGTNTSANTNNVGVKTAAEVVATVNVIPSITQSVNDIQGEVDDLFATYGSTTAAAASAASALTYKNAAEIAATNAETAEDAAVLAKNQANTILGQTTTAKNAAETASTNATTAKTAAQTAQTAAETAQGLANTAKTAAQTAKTAAETAATNSAGSATTASGHATTATNKASEADGSAIAAAGSATIATTKAGQASTSASNAASSATNAAGSASTATTQAGIATTSKNAAGLSATAAGLSETNAASSATTAGNQATIATQQSLIASAKASKQGLTENANFDLGNISWRAGYSVSDTSTLTPLTIASEYEGRSNVLLFNTGVRTDISGSLTPVSTDRKYKLRLGIYETPAAGSSLYIGFQCFGANGGTIGPNIGLGYPSVRPSNQVATPGWLDFTSNVIAGVVDSSSSGAGFRTGTVAVRPILFYNNGNIAEYAIGVDYYYLEDVTESMAAEGSATAANTAASSATASQTAAGLSASAANTAKITAEVAKGTAQTAATAASGSAVTATDAASTATTEAGLSAYFKDVAAAKAAKVDLVINGDFSQGNKGWVDTYAGPKSRDAYDPSGLNTPGWTYYPTSNGRSDVLLSRTGQRDDIASDFIPVDPARTYEIKVGFRIGGTGGASPYISCGLFDSNQLYVTNRPPVTSLGGSITTSGGYSTGWHDVTLYIGGVGANFGQFTTDTAYLRLASLANWELVAGASISFDYFRMSDITESLAATNQANISTAQAVIATAQASTATTQAGIATSSKNAAGTSAANAATSAGNAASSATNAAGSASTATTQAGIATGASGTAGGHAAAAGTSATNAASSATAASTSATVAQNAKIEAAVQAKTIGLTVNAQFTEGKAGWNTYLTHTATYEGRSDILVNPANSYNTIYTAQKVPVDLSKKYRIKAGWHSSTSTQHQYIGFQCFDASGATVGGNGGNGYTFLGAVAVGWNDFTSGIITGINDNSSSGAGFRTGTTQVLLLVLANYFSGAGVTAYDYLYLEDVTAVEAAASSATASAASASSATASQTAAASSATAANIAKLAAETAKGTAEIARNEAVTAKNTATSAATTATTQANLAAGSATTAGNSATAAAGSATTAGTSATNAATSATVAVASELAANVGASETYPSDFSQGGKFFSGLGGSEITAGTPDVNYAPAISYPSTSSGKVARTTNAIGYIHFTIRKRIPIVQNGGRKFRITSKAKLITAPAVGTVKFTSVVYGLDSTYTHLTYTGHLESESWAGSSNYVSLVAGVETTIIHEFVLKTTPTEDPSNNKTPAFVMPGVYFFNSTSPYSTGTVDLISVKVEDITSEAASLGSASASAASAATASASQTAAGNSATAANNAKIAAEAANGTAQTAASAASGSATTATNQAAIATTQAGISASFANDAKGAATSLGLNLNSHMEAGTSGWYNGYSPVVASGTTSLVADSDFAGASSVLKTSASHAYTSYIRSTFVPIEVGRTYRTRYRVYKNGGAGLAYAGYVSVDATKGASVGENAGLNYNVVSGNNIPAGWNEFESAPFTRANLNTGAVGIILIAFLNYNPSPASSWAIDYFYVEDITESVTAASQATISTAQAVIATNQASAATTQAGLSATYRSQAEGFKNTASAQATIATNQAVISTNAAASAVSTAVLQASLSGDYITENPQFLNWPTGQAYPTGYVTWESTPPTRATIGQNTNGCKFPVTTGDWGMRYNSPAEAFAPGSWVVICADVEANGYAGSGIFFDWRDTPATISYGTAYLRFGSEPDMDGVTSSSGSLGVIRRFRKIVQVPSSPARTKGLMYALANWSGFGGGVSAKTLTFGLVGVRLATAGEIATKTVIPDIAASVTTETAARVAADNILYAKYGVRLDVNGYVSGFVQNNNGASSDFNILADKFKIAMPGVTPKTIFGVDSTGVKIAGDLYMGTGRIIADTGTYMRVLGTGFGVSNQFIEWFGPKMAINLCSPTNAIQYLKTNGDAYFGGSLSAGTLTNKNSTTTVSTTAEVTVGPFGSNGGAITQTMSFQRYYNAGTATYPATTAGRTAFLNTASANGATNKGAGNWSGSGSVDGTATIQLRNASNTLLATLSVSGGTYSWTGTEPIPGDSPGQSQYTSSFSATQTTTDNSGSTADRTLTAKITAMSMPSASSQTLALICVEE